MDTLDFLLRKYNITKLDERMPHIIPNVRRQDLGALFRELGFKNGAEIGVWEGWMSETLCKGNPGVHLYCIDPWIPYKGYLDHTRQDKLKDAYETAKERLAPYNTTFIRKFSLDAAKEIPDESLDFVYIDGNHSFLSVVEDLTVWSAKVRTGGIIAGHDYKYFPPEVHINVVEAVHAYTLANYIHPWFVLGTRKYRRNKKERRDKERSYLWVKQDRQLLVDAFLARRAAGEPDPFYK